jgi:hypothetical protein
MKKQINLNIQACVLQSMFYALLAGTVCVSPFTLAQRNAKEQSPAELSSASRGLEKVANALPADIIVVTNTNDSGPGSLRDALVDAKDGDTIDVTGVSGTILLTSGELQVTHNVTINGPGVANLAINGNHLFRVFYIYAFYNATISGFTITNGFAGNGGGIYLDGGNNRTLIVSDCTIGGNSAEYGGGICSYAGTLIVDNCTISGNSASVSGGGILSLGGGALGGSSTLTLSNSTVNDNAAVGGGGISNLAANLGEGGDCTAIVNNSTISGNTATDGGGILNSTGTGFVRLLIANSTVSGNWATGNGGGIYISQDGGSATLELSNLILNTGSSGENIFNNGGTVTSHGYNLSSDDGGGVLTGPGDQINTDPMLCPLQANGGPTFTHALLPGSPAINAGDPTFTPPPIFDQRGPGFDRVVNGRIDIGSFEVEGPRPTPTPRPSPTGRPRPTPHPRSTL